MPWLACLISIQRTAPPWHGAVVHDRAFFASDAFADEPSKSGCLFTIKIGFQSMADRFVQEHAGPAGTKHNFHFTGRGFASVQLQNCLSRRFLGEIFGSLITEEQMQSYPTAAACAAASGIDVGLVDAAHAQARERLGIFSKGPIAT